MSEVLRHSDCGKFWRCLRKRLRVWWVVPKTCGSFPIYWSVRLPVLILWQAMLCPAFQGNCHTCTPCFWQTFVPWGWARFGLVEVGTQLGISGPVLQWAGYHDTCSHAELSPFLLPFLWAYLHAVVTPSWSSGPRSKLGAEILMWFVRVGPGMSSHYLRPVTLVQNESLKSQCDCSLQVGERRLIGGVECIYFLSQKFFRSFEQGLVRVAPDQVAQSNHFGHQWTFSACSVGQVFGQTTYFWSIWNIGCGRERLFRLWRECLRYWNIFLCCLFGTGWVGEGLNSRNYAENIGYAMWLCLCLFWNVCDLFCSIG